MTYQYSEVEFVQGTPEWRKWRQGGFGASDIPTLMGQNPWSSTKKLLNEKRNGGSNIINAAMRRGTELEPVARKEYCKKVGFDVTPICIQHNDYFWARASLDGISDNRNQVVEIKCGNSAFQYAERGMVPQYYKGQLQYILFITNLEKIHYWCYLPSKGGVLIEVGRDDFYIKNIVDTCESYKDFLH